MFAYFEKNFWVAEKIFHFTVTKMRQNVKAAEKNRDKCSSENVFRDKMSITNHLLWSDLKYFLKSFFLLIDIELICITYSFTKFTINTNNVAWFVQLRILRSDQASRMSLADNFLFLTWQRRCNRRRTHCSDRSQTGFGRDWADGQRSRLFLVLVTRGVGFVISTTELSTTELFRAAHHRSEVCCLHIQ